MKPHIHALSSAKKFGGQPSDYIEIHNTMDWSKSAMADVRHRAIFHSAFGIYVVEKIFGETIVNSDGDHVSVRDIAEQHVMEDLGFIPSLEKWLGNMPIEDWMISQSVKKKGVKLEELPPPSEDTPTKEQVDRETADRIKELQDLIDKMKDNPMPYPIRPMWPSPATPGLPGVPAFPTYPWSEPYPDPWGPSIIKD